MPSDLGHLGSLFCILGKQHEDRRMRKCDLRRRGRPADALNVWARRSFGTLPDAKGPADDGKASGRRASQGSTWM
jgi:hypothetical protein